LADKPRVLVFQSDGAQPNIDFPGWEVVRAANVAEGLALLQSQTFDGIFTSAEEPKAWQRVGTLLQNDFILEVLREGVAVVQPDLNIVWANSTFENWCDGPVKGHSFYEALGNPEILGPDFCPFHSCLVGKTITTRLSRRDNRYLELRVTPISAGSGKVQQFITLCRDISAEVLQQQKLDALHQASRELADLQVDQLADMCLEERIELLKQNIRKLTKDLLHYDVIEIRLLREETGELIPLLAEGMTEQAANRALYAKQEGNGVTGFVAATGKSYLCSDTTVDPLYIVGADGARSSLTVALTLGDKVIGTFNVESPQPGGFTELDVQFTEIFCREVAVALHTLELLTAEKVTTTTQSIDAINREVALPVDEILTAATSILERWIGHEPEMAEKLRKILSAARSIRQSIMQVGENLAPASTMPLSYHAPAEPAPKLKGLRVLVVDNDERVRRSAHGILGRFGCIVETARDGQEALSMARLNPYDAMLADIRLPDLSGLDVYRELRQVQPAARVILMTGFGYDPSHSIVNARQEGLKFVLYKPFRVDQLIDCLQSPPPPIMAKPLVIPEPVKA
jgi:CheY-like chemotaxis protein/GAF domain-containing protein